MSEQATTTTERVLRFCCLDCDPVDGVDGRDVDRVGEPVTRTELATRLGRHRKEHPDHGRTFVGYPRGEEPDA